MTFTCRLKGIAYVLCHRSLFMEERLIHGETRWIAIWARGAEWSWLTPEEAVAIGRDWVEKYGDGVHPRPKMIAAE